VSEPWVAPVSRWRADRGRVGGEGLQETPLLDDGFEAPALAPIP